MHRAEKIVPPVDLDHLVLRGWTIERALAELGLALDGRGPRVRLRGHLVTDRHTFAVPEEGVLRCVASWGAGQARIGVRPLRRGHASRTDSASVDPTFQIWSEEHADVFLPLVREPSPGRREWSATRYYARGGVLQLALGGSELAPWGDARGNAAMSVETVSATELVLRLSDEHAPEPSLDALVCHLTVHGV